MARMIAADDERGSRKVMLSRNRQTTIRDEKHSAEGLKHGTTRYRRQKHVLRFRLVRHWMSSVVRYLSSSGAHFVRQNPKECLAFQRYLQNADETLERAAGGDCSLTPEGVPTPFTVARSRMLSNQAGTDGISGGKIGKNRLAGFCSCPCQREAAWPAKHNRMTKGIDHVGHDKSPGIEIDFPAKPCRVRSEGDTKGLVKPDLKIDCTVCTMRYFRPEQL